MIDRSRVSVRADPAPETWGAMALEHFARLSPERRAARAEVGLPVDRPVVMTGHQAGFWHPGILAKYIAADRLAKRIGGTGAAVVVDHDVVDPLRLEAVRASGDGSVERAVVLLGGRRRKPVLPRLEAPMRGADLHRPGDGLMKPDAAAVEAIIAALSEHEGATSLGEQVARANADLLKDSMSVSMFSAQQMVRTPGWKRFFEMAVEDAPGCTRAYNRAVGSHPEAGIPRLFAMAREHRWELPFWMLDREHGRRALYAEMVEQEGFDGDLLATRAMSLTASVRRDLCDLFIHGVGGAIYDRATDVWIREWLGEELAPTVSITADLRRAIPVDARRNATDEDLAWAKWIVHSARHNPELLGEQAAAETKHGLLERIDATEYGSLQRAELYREMHGGLEEVRARRSRELEGLARTAQEMGQGIEVRTLEAKRDWPSVMYERERLEELADRIGWLLSAAPRPAGR